MRLRGLPGPSRPGLIEAPPKNAPPAHIPLASPGLRARASLKQRDAIRRNDDNGGLPGPSRPGLIEAAIGALSSLARCCASPGLRARASLKLQFFASPSRRVSRLPGPSRPGLIEASTRQSRIASCPRPPRAFAPGPHRSFMQRAANVKNVLASPGLRARASLKLSDEGRG